MLCRVMCLLMFVAWTAERPGDDMYFANWRSPFQLFGPFFVSLPVIRQPLWNLLLMAFAPLCLLQRGAFRKRAWPMDVAIAVSLGAIAVTFLWGLARGGSAYQSYYQLHGFLVSLLVAFALTATIRSPRDLKAVGLTVLAAALVRGSLAIYFFYAHVKGRAIYPYPMFMTSHDDSLLFVAGVLVTVAWALARMRGRAWLLAAFVTAHLFLAMKVNNRRLAWVEIVLSLAFAYLLLPRGSVRRRVNRGLLVAVPALALYVAVGWDRPETIFVPLHAFDTTTGDDEDASSRARNEENLNLVYTYLSNPLLGIGWGHPYVEVSRAFTQGFGPRFWQYPYLPHNSLVGLVAFSGFVGLLGIWSVVPMTAFLASRGYRFARSPVERAATMAAFCLLPAYGVQAFGDIGFQALTGGLLLAAAMAVASRVSVWSGAWTWRVASRASRAGVPGVPIGRPVTAPSPSP